LAEALAEYHKQLLALWKKQVRERMLNSRPSHEFQSRPSMMMKDLKSTTRAI
jgi:hypothetical protein